MTAAIAAILDPVSRRARLRLMVAIALSLALHFVLLVYVSVRPTGSASSAAATIYARLERATPEPAADGHPPPDMLIPAKTAAVAPARIVASQPLAPQPRVEAEPSPEPNPVDPPSSSSAIYFDLPLIRDPTYYPAKQLDVYPLPLTEVKFDYPESAAAERIDGRLLMLLLIDEFGVVNEASVVEAHPEGYFEESALAVFRATRFSPAQKQGRPVKSRVLMQVRYESEAAVR